MTNTVTVVPTTGSLCTVSGSPDPADNGQYDLTFYNDRKRLVRIMKRRRTGARSIAELMTRNTTQ